MKGDINVYLFTGTILLTHILYLSLFFGMILIDEHYLRIFSTFIQLGVCIFLIVRFFPAKRLHTLTALDSSIIFYCATFLLMNVVLVELYTTFLAS